MKAMILAAGLGTRLKPFTDNHPKALAQVSGKSLLQRNIEYLISFGIKDIAVNVHHFADQIRETLQQNNNWGANIFISDETDQVLETGGGLKKASSFFENQTDPFVLMNVDILSDLDLHQMISQQQKNNSLATLAVTDRSTSRYLLFDENNLLCGWRNKNTGELKGKEGTEKAFSGIHVISPKIFSLITEEGKFSMVDLYLRLCTDHHISSFDHSGSKFIDVGKPESIVKAEAMFT